METTQYAKFLGRGKESDRERTVEGKLENIMKI
jgi:hypothetical protein